jgi:hypothetical protein
MMMLPTLAVIFAGLTGGHHERVEKQVQKVVRALHVDVKPLPAAVIHKLTHHDASTRDAVRKLHVDAVIAGEVTAKGDLRIVIYDRDGKLASFTESSLTNDVLTADDISVLRDNLASDLEPFLGAAPEPEPEPAPAPPPAPVPAPPPARPAPVPVAAPAKSSPPTIEMDGDDSDNPLGDSTPPPATAPEAAPAESVSANDIEALMDASAEVTAEEAASSPSLGPELHLGARAGFGIAQRTFSPGPSALSGYGSSPVGAVNVAVDVKPMAHVGLHLATERTLGMTTPLDSGDASTVVSRWEATGGYALPLGRIEIAPQLGVGRRAFSIHSEDPARSPDSSYNYLVFGARGGMTLGRIGVEAFAAVEPVVSGKEPTEMALGEATRWAIDGGAAVDVHFGHAVVRAAADYQQFTWTWNMAGARGAGGATDAYLTGSLSIGAEY